MTAGSVVRVKLLTRKPFAGQVALITGAARGIGEYVARGYVARGGRVSLVGLEPDLLEELAAELGDAAIWREADVRNSDELRRAIDSTAAHFGRIDHVLANAGIASYGTVRQVEDESFDRVIDVNLGGVFRTLKYSIPHLQRSRGYVLAVASMASFTPLAGLAPYAASKAGCEALALSARQEVAHLGVKVGVCHPAWIDTDIVRNAEADLPTFRAIRQELPYPANTTTSVETCAKTILSAMRWRKARVYIPRSVLLANWTKALVASPLAWFYARRLAKQYVPELEREVAELGRFHHTHVPKTETD